MTEQTITNEDINRAMERVGQVTDDLARARIELMKMLRRAKREGLLVASGCEADCGCIHVGVD